VVKVIALADRPYKLFDDAPIGVLVLSGRQILYANKMAGSFHPDWSHAGRLADEFDLKAADWQLGDLALNTATSVDDEGHVLLFLSDQTERQRLEAQYRQSQKMQAVGQLAGGISHDFNNLLTAIQGYTDLLLERHQPGDDSFPDLLQIKQNTTRATNLVKQLLAFSRQQSLKPTALDVGPVITDLALMLGRLLGEVVTLETDLAADLPPIIVDQGQLEQVIINLAVNGRDAMPNGGTLVLGAAMATLQKPLAHYFGTVPAGAYVCLTIRDNGEGIPKAVLDKIFDPFFTTKPRGKGTGLGLATVYGIVEQSGGHIVCDSAAGKGTSFSLYFPVAQPVKDVGESVEDTPAEDRLQPVSSGPAKILLVEDEAAVRTLALKALEKDGHDVTAAEDGDEALSIVADGQAGPFDLLVTDVVMPGLDGPGLWREMEKLVGPTRVIFMSGYAEEEMRKALGVDGDKVHDTHFLAKPFSLKALMRTVAQVLSAG